VAGVVRPSQRWHMGRRTIALATVFVLGACTTPGASPAVTQSVAPPSAPASEAASAQASSGPEAIKTVEGTTFQGPWYKYDFEACKYAEVDDHPDAYVPVLKATPDLTLTYLPEGQTAEYDTTLNEGVRKATELTGMTFNQFSTEYPNPALPVQVTNQAVTVESDVVISGNVLSDQYPQIQSILEENCIPFINQFAVPGTTDVPRFQGDNYVTGELEAKAAAKIISARGWPVADIRIVTCADPAITTEPGTVYDINRGFRETLVEELGLSADQIEATDLKCTIDLGPEGSRVAMADWITAHPDAKYVVGTAHADDLYSVGLANALRDAKFGDKALVAGRGGGSATLDLIKSGDPIMAVTGVLSFPLWGEPMVAMAQDAALGNPIPYLVSPPVIAVTSENVDQFLP